MNNSGKLFLFIVLTALLGGCQPVKVVNYSPGVVAKTMTAFKTFSFYQLHVTGNKGPNFLYNIEACKRAIASEMARRGFTEVESGGGLAINIGVILESKNSSDEMQYMSEPDYTKPDEPKNHSPLKTGTITIEMVDASKNMSVWIGTFSGGVPKNQAARKENIDKGVKILFEQFPVKVKS